MPASTPTAPPKDSLVVRRPGTERHFWRRASVDCHNWQSLGAVILLDGPADKPRISWLCVGKLPSSLRCGAFLSIFSANVRTHCPSHFCLGGRRAYVLHIKAGSKNGFIPNYHFWRRLMAWELLFTSDIGILSLLTIGFILVMAVYIWRYAMKHVKDDEKAHGGARQVAGMH
jgi:hypothetical protein